MERLDMSRLSFEQMLEREWLVTNQIGGFASSTLSGLNSRKYHGLLVAAMAPPVRRMVLLSRVEETVVCDGWPVGLGCNEYPGTVHPEGHRCLRAFNHDPFPRWAYQGDGWTIEKSLRLLRGQNTVLLSYSLLGGNREVQLELRPLFALRPIHELSYQWNGRLDAHTRPPGHHRIPPTLRTPEVFFAHDGRFAGEGYWYLNTIYRREQERGYSGLEDLWSPGLVQWALSPGQTVHFVCSAEPIDLAAVVEEAERQLAHERVPAVGAPPDLALEALLRAADQFVLSLPTSEGRSTGVITQYPWAAPSVRDGLIAFPGLFLVTGRCDEGLSLLLGLGEQLVDGLLPTVLRENGSSPAYSGADTSLWYINAIHHYLRYAPANEATLTRLFAHVMQVLQAYQQGTGLGIRMDAQGLLGSVVHTAGTSWMDAQVDGKVVTHRSGRTVELNALWYNALRIAAAMAGRIGRDAEADSCERLARSVQAAFNERFWNEDIGCCYDVVADESADASIRPNQLLAVSLPYAVLDRDRQAKVVECVQAKLLTPHGVRTLAPDDPQYVGQYGGNVASRDRAYHQGSVFPWLLGPMVTAFVRVHGRSDAPRQTAQQWLSATLSYLQGQGLGQICELFDGDAPHRPGGAIASSRAVGEILRCYVEDVLDRAPTPCTRIEHPPAAPPASRAKRPPVPR